MDHLLEPTCAASSTGHANLLLTTLVSALVNIHCNISTPDMWPKDHGEKALHYGIRDYDFVVIGAGTAGSVVAGRLAENPHHTVLLIEAGGDPPVESEIPALFWETDESSIYWRYPLMSNKRSCLGRINENCLVTKGKLLGGSHAVNSMIYLHGTPRDYDEWEYLGNPSWGWKDVKYYFRKTENFTGDNTYGERGTKGPLNVEPFNIPREDQKFILKAARELGYQDVDDFVASNYLGFGQVYGTLQEGRRMTTAKAFLAKRRRNLHVIKHAVASRILFNKKHRAEGVEFTYKGSYDLRVFAKKEIIVSAGAIETPKLLMLSGLGPKPHLDALGIPVIKHLPVGENLHDHVRVDFFMKLNYRERNPLGALDSIYEQWIHRKGLYGSGILDLSAFFDLDGDGYYPEVQVLFALTPNISAFADSYNSHIYENIKQQVKPTDNIGAAFLYLLQPASRGKVRLQSASYCDSPLVWPNYLKKDLDVKVLVKGIKKLFELTDTETFRSLNGELLRVTLPECDQYEFRSDQYWRCYVRFMSNSGHRPVGTAKMGPSNDKNSVVDAELKVRGVKGLRVIDSSIMPNIISAVSVAPTVMIAEKGVSIIKRHWK